MNLVYRITNRINGKGYIGMTSRTLEQRWASHQSAARQNSPFRFHSAIRKYGPDVWEFEVLAENMTIDEARIFEEQAIEKYGLQTKTGYNAKPGGCGGWIVPPEKYHEWKQKISKSQTGELNGNANPITNDEIIAIAMQFINENNRIPTKNVLMEYGKNKNVKIPNFGRVGNVHRFGGEYKNLAKILEEKSGLKYDPYFKSEETKQKIAEASKGSCWYHNPTLKLTKQIKHGEMPPVGWILGRKKYD
jgi:hypothetical protein